MKGRHIAATGKAMEDVTMSRPSETATRARPSYAPAGNQRTNRRAIWSLILSILWLGGLGSLAGIMLGFSARRRIAETGQRGAGLATAGIVVGAVTLVFAIAYWVFIARYTGGAGHGGGGGGSGY
jgi:hypothetical protein